jgi:hypothetical protein
MLRTVVVRLVLVQDGERFPKAGEFIDTNRRHKMQKPYNDFRLEAQKHCRKGTFIFTLFLNRL